MLKNRLQQKQQSSRDWCNYLSEQYRNGRNWAAIHNRRALLEKISPEDIREAARSYLAKETLSIIEMRPESEKQK